MALSRLQSEVTGTVWKIETQIGQQVTENQPLVIVESMKMEIPVCASRAGTVVEILVQEGDAVEDGQDVVVIE